jgi:hypothetical protein
LPDEIIGDLFKRLIGRQGDMFRDKTRFVHRSTSFPPKTF